MARKPAKSDEPAANVPAKRAAAKPGRRSDVPREIALKPTEALHPPPRPLGELLGHDRALGVIYATVKSERVHHAWIFHGPPGVGKFTAALGFAGLLLDPTTAAGLDGTPAADPESAVSRLLAAGTHPDLHVVVKELARHHDDADVRNRKLTSIPTDVLKQFVLEPGVMGATLRHDGQASKVFVVDEAELLNTQGQNALLKFLEEPPPRTVIVLVTSAEEQLLPTIRSRCQRVYFGPLSVAEMKAWMKRSGFDAAPSEKEWLLAFADGSPGAVKSAVEVGLAAWRTRVGPLLDAARAGKYSPELGPAMYELVDVWAKKWVDDHDNASKEAANRAGADWMFRLVASDLRRWIRGGADEAVLASVDALRQAESEIDANVNPLFVFEKLSSELAAAKAGAGL